MLACVAWGLLGVRQAQSRVFTHSLYERFYADGSTCDHRVVVDLTGEWKSNAGRNFRIPFSSDVHERLELNREFFLAEPPTDSLVLYFEGLAQCSEIYLNDRLLVLTSDAFEPVGLRLSPELFLGQWNRLRVVLYEGCSRRGKFDPPVFIGIHRPVYVLERMYEPRQPVLFPRLVRSDSTLVLLPYGKRGYQVDERQFKMDLKLLAESGVQALYIPYRLSNREYAWIAEAGLGLSLSLGRWVALYEEPESRSDAIWGWPVWKKFDGTGRWGIYADSAGLRRPLVPEAEQVWLAGLSILLLALLAYWKAAVPVVFDLLLGRMKRRSGKGRTESERPVSGVVIQVLLVRLLLLGFGGWSVSLLLTQAGCLHWFDVFASPSLARRFVEYSGGQALTLWAGWLGWLGLLLVLRQLVLWVAGGVYGMRELGWQVLQIENQGSFPALWGILGAGIVGLVQSPAVALPWAYGLIGFLLTFNVYSYLYTYGQLTARLGLRPYLVILYICAVELAPWLVLL